MLTSLIGSNRLWNFLIAFFTPFITRAIGFSYGFVFAGCNLANAIIVFFFLYESSGISLEAVDYMYNVSVLRCGSCICLKAEPVFFS